MKRRGTCWQCRIEELETRVKRLDKESAHFAHNAAREAYRAEAKKAELEQVTKVRDDLATQVLNSHAEELKQHRALAEEIRNLRTYSIDFECYTTDPDGEFMLTEHVRAALEKHLGEL